MSVSQSTIPRIYVHSYVFGHLWGLNQIMNMEASSNEISSLVTFGFFIVSILSLSLSLKSEVPLASDRANGLDAWKYVYTRWVVFRE